MRKLLTLVALLCALMVASSGFAVAQDEPLPLPDPAPGDSATTAPTATAPTNSTPDPSTTVPAPPEPEPDAAAPEPSATAPEPTAPPTTTAVATTAPAAPVAVAQQCEPSYPTICLPPGIDVNCGDIPQWGNFVVLPSDPFRLDGNPKDGIGCEGNTSGAPRDPNLVTTTLPTTAPTTTSPPVTVAPTTVPAQVAGTTQTQQRGALPVTGAPSTLLGVLGVVIMALGVVLVATHGRFERTTRGGFTVTLTNLRGECLTFHVRTRR